MGSFDLIMADEAAEYAGMSKSELYQRMTVHGFRPFSGLRHAGDVYYLLTDFNAFRGRTVVNSEVVPTVRAQANITVVKPDKPTPKPPTGKTGVRHATAKHRVAEAPEPAVQGPEEESDPPATPDTETPEDREFRHRVERLAQQPKHVLQKMAAGLNIPNPEKFYRRKALAEAIVREGGKVLTDQSAQGADSSVTKLTATIRNNVRGLETVRRQQRSTAAAAVAHTGRRGSNRGVLRSVEFSDGGK